MSNEHARGQFFRDSASRLTYTIPTSDNYTSAREHLIQHFGLKPVGKVIVGPDAIFQDFSLGSQLVGIEWDIWTGFTIVAKSNDSEELVHDIAQWMEANL